MAESKTQPKKELDVYEYITTEENNYRTRPVPVADGWDFHMYEHIRQCFLMKNSKFWKGNNDFSRPYKNIVRPVLNVGYRTEGFDVKDITPFVNDIDNSYKSFLVKKFHAPWARKNNMDTFIDEVVENSVDYDFVLVKNVNDIRPQVVPPQQIAFCDQTDVDSGPICLRHQFSIDMVLEMKGKWDDDGIEMVIAQAQAKKDVGNGKKEAKTPGKYIELFELHGSFPETWLNKEPTKNQETGEYEYDTTYTDEKNYVKQVQIVAYYVNQDNKKTGITLFKQKDTKTRFKSLVIQKIFGRAVGYGGIEALFDPQIWTNYNEIQLKEMLDYASMILLQTADDSYEGRQNIEDVKKGTILTHKENMPIEQVQMSPVNINLFNDAVARWEQTARTSGSANDAQLGEDPTAGTPFKLQDQLVQQGEGIHVYRQGKIATFIGEIYRDWILEWLTDEMNKGHKWVEELSLEEMQYIAKKISIDQVNQSMIAAMENGDDISGATNDIIAEVAQTAFLDSGNRHFLEIMEDELKDIPVDVEVNVAGKQKDLAQISDKLTNIFRQIIANPAVLKIPGMAKIFNEILEASGLSPVDFTSISNDLPETPDQNPAGVPVKSPMQMNQVQQPTSQQLASN